MVGLYDDTQSLYGNPARTFGTLRTLRADVVRVSMFWGGRLGGQPAKAVVPRMDDPALFGRTKQPSVGVSALSGQATPQGARFGYALLQASEIERRKTLKDANPGLKLLAYKNLAATMSWAVKDGVDEELLPTGVGFAFAEKEHPDWFLKDDKGQRVESCEAQGRWLMDVGDAEYQTAWLEKVAAELKANGWDGVFMDDANASPARHLCGRTLAKYGTDAAYAAAVDAFLAKVGPALQERGLLAVTNVRVTPDAAGRTLFTRWLQHSSGVAVEGWTKSGRETSGHLAGDAWSFQQELLRETERANKIFLALTQGPDADRRSRRYARSSFLLAWGGGASALVYIPEGTTDGWSPESAVEVGTPFGEPYRAGTAWRRDFTGGTVVVNPTATPVTVKLGDTFMTPSGEALSTVTLEGSSGVVLRIPNYVGGNDAAVAKRRPRNALDPADPAYDWSLYDRAVRYAAVNRVKIVFSIMGSPKWSNGGRGFKYAPENARDLEQFAYAAAKRYSGSFVDSEKRVLPPVRHWLAWNEPNNPVFLLPQYRRVGSRWVIQSARDYAKICNAVYTGVHASLLRGEKVACGATAPRGNNAPQSDRPAVTPLAFLKAAKQAGMRRFDAYAHHPYYLRPHQTPRYRPPNGGGVVLGNIDALLRDLTKLYGRKPLWITEYGYQTWKPDRKFGVTWAKQAAYLKDAYKIARKHPRIDMMLWFMLRDDKSITKGWQSGFFTAGGKRKPSFDTFRKLP